MEPYIPFNDVVNLLNVYVDLNWLAMFPTTVMAVSTADQSPRTKQRVWKLPSLMMLRSGNLLAVQRHASCTSGPIELSSVVLGRTTSSPENLA